MSGQASNSGRRGGGGDIAVVAEKPSVARDIARVLGARTPGKGLLTGNGYVVTWAIGHLVALAQPHEVRPEWKRWVADDLPLLPGQWPLVVLPDTEAQFRVVAALLRSTAIGRVVCATDAGREGELIFRYLYEKVGCRKPVLRLWLSSLTPEAIRQGFARLRPAADFDPLADAARGRSRADWLVGMNLSRATTLAHGETLHVGRVQTPTLALLVEREKAIRDFVPQDYLEVAATFEVATGRYQGTWFRDPPLPTTTAIPSEPDRSQNVATAPTADEAARIVARAKAGQAQVASVEAETRRVPPPLLYDLTDLQRHANRLYGMSARDTLQAAQSLYESKKLLSYPRTDSRHLSTDVAATLPAVVAAIAAPYAAHVAPGTGERPLSRRFVDDLRVSDHHAILPTAVPAAGVTLTLGERRVYEMVCRRLLMAWHEPHVFSVTTVVTEVRGPEADPVLDHYRSSGTVVDVVGWKVLEPRSARAQPAVQKPGEATAADVALPPGLTVRQRVTVVDAEVVARQTRPPRRLTDATLLTAMETAGRTLDDRDLAEAMKQHGLGTPATRAEILETLLRREYVERQGRALAATAKGIALVERVHPDLKSAALTGEWEAELRRIEHGQTDLAGFMQRIEAYVRQLVAATLATPRPSPPALRGEARAAPRGSASSAAGPDTRNSLGTAPARATSVSGSGRRSEATAPSGPSAGIHSRREPPSTLPREQSSSAPKPPSARAVAPPATPARTGTAAVPSGAGPRASVVAGPAPGRGTVVRAADVAARPAPLATGATPPSAAVAEPTLAPQLHELLRSRFRLEAFRPRQEAVCRAVANGQDVLLVMPTGAGKSLCYQLPGLARGGTTLVISPLIALMEDQVAKLNALGLRAERIHSGRDRERSRQALGAYLDGRLDFLFVAPERWRVPGFADALARRRPSLAAVDEAHCISEWGHDFRPDYRLLGEHLPRLRPAPVIALTATATPRVQDDIAAQLGLQPRRFIHGFRRENIAIEVVPLPQSDRPGAVERLLADRARRPAIVYTPTRREADELGRNLGRAFPAAAYHAGMATAVRDRVQAEFLSGRLEVIVATIAFGMGVDKADIRTVVHTALPGSLEGFSQEIGRAGRDGRPSRAVLLHSWSDRRTHEFFFDKGYPEPEVLERVFRALGSEPRPPEELRRRLRLDGETMETALEKLWIHGGARMSTEGGDPRATRGSPGWLEPYRRQRQHRQEQIERVQRYALDHACRMVALVRHFGDREDSGRPCGTCDVCDPAACLVRTTRPPRRNERTAAAAALALLRERDGQSTGRLHSQCESAGLDRQEFEEVLGGLVRAGLLQLRADTFTTEGREITFKRAWLTAAATAASAGPLDFTLPGEADAEVASEPRPARPGDGTRRGRSTRTPTTPKKTKKPRPQASVVDDATLAALRDWRLAEARRAGVPAFRILHERTLTAIAATRPQDAAALRAIPGLGTTLIKRHGTRILALCRNAGRPADSRHRH